MNVCLSINALWAFKAFMESRSKIKGFFFKIEMFLLIVVLRIFRRWVYEKASARRPLCTFSGLGD